MQDIKQVLADAVRESRTKLGLSQEKLAEYLGLDTRTILNIKAGRSNPKYEVLYPLITYLKIHFYQKIENEQLSLQRLLTTQKDCMEQEADALFPMVRYLLKLLRK